MARTLTPTELALLRSKSQACELYLAIHTPAVVFTARLNGEPASDDRVYQIDYDDGNAGWANTIPDQTVYVGATPGGWEYGMIRLREALSGVSGTMKIAETSEIEWIDNSYLTVVDEFGLWPRHLHIAEDGTIYMDYDVEYTNQHSVCAPVPVLGPAATVLWLTGTTVSVQFDASDSWVIDSIIASYSWNAPGSSASSGMNTATPTVVYNAAGTYRVSCTITTSNGASCTGYRYIFVFDESHPPTRMFELESCDGEYERGGWGFRITMWDEAALPSVRDRAMVVLFARDWYGTTETSIGPVEGRENIVAIGWINGESIEWNTDRGCVHFDVEGPQFWLNEMMGFPSGIEDRNGTPTTWAEFNDLTVDKGLWHFLHWRTTATRCMDCYLTGDTRQIAVFDAPIGTLWEQISRVANGTILAHPRCDRYGRLFVEIDAQYLPIASRSGIPIVQSITQDDWKSPLNIERVTVPPVAMIDLSGVAYRDGNAQAIFSLARGHIPARYGKIERIDRLALESQAQSNALAGLIYGQRSGMYPHINISLAYNHRAFDIAPYQYARLTIAEDDTERGISGTMTLIPRRLSFQYSDGALRTEVEFEKTTTGEGLGVDGDPPPEPPLPGQIPPPPPPPVPPSPIPKNDIGAMILSRDQVAITYNLEAASPIWFNADPNGDLVGVFASLDVCNNQAYLTTYDPYHNIDDEVGLWYCEDVLGIKSWTGGTVWRLIKSAEDAIGECDVIQARFMAVRLNGEGEVCAPVHGNAETGKESGAYIGRDGTVAIVGLGKNFVDEPFLVVEDSAIHCVWYDGKLESWRIGGHAWEFPALRPYHVVGGAGGWDIIRYYMDSNFVNAIYSIAGNWILKDEGTGTPSGGGIYNASLPASDRVDDDVLRTLGIHTDTVGDHYIKVNGNTDLCYNKTVIGDADTAASGFGAGREGSMAAYFPNDSTRLAWICGNFAYLNVHRIVIVYDFIDAVWYNKTGNLSSAIGDSWSGWTNIAVGNSIIRTFLI